MQFIKSASVYKATIPSAELLKTHLAEKPFTDPMPTEATSVGFVPRESGELVTEFHGGLSFQVRIDEKIVPASVVKTETEKVVKKIAQEQGRKVGRKERKDITEGVVMSLRAVALVKTAVIACYYNTNDEYLIIPTTKQRFCDVITSSLIDAVGSVKTQTIHVSNVKQGLTTRLQDWLASEGESESFGDFHPHGDVSLTDGSQKLTAKMVSLQTANDGLQEAIKKDFRVTSIGLQMGETSFRLTHDFKFRSIETLQTEEGDQSENIWAHLASVEVLIISAVLNKLCDMFGYKPPGDDESDKGGE